MPNTATLSKRFQVSIPEAIREARNWEPGQRFAFIPKGAGVLLVPVPERADLKGMAKGGRNTNLRDHADRFRSDLPHAVARKEKR